MKRWVRDGVLFLVFGLAFGGGVASSAESTEAQATLHQAQFLRNDFIRLVREAGGTCSAPVPSIALENRPSYGSYDEKSNTVLTSEWSTMPRQQKVFFTRTTKASRSALSARQLFEVYVHQWTYIHEMAHWWQSCHQTTRSSTPYSLELGANRIALAYWRSSNPEVVAVMETVSRSLVAKPSQAFPLQSDLERYFNRNDERKHLSSTRFYPWFQATLILSLAKEPPATNFMEALQR